jgi:hypothetical protein
MRFRCRQDFAAARLALIARFDRAAGEPIWRSA